MGMGWEAWLKLLRATPFNAPGIVAKQATREPARISVRAEEINLRRERVQVQQGGSHE